MANTAEELLLRVSGDSSGGQDAVQALADALSSRLAPALKDTATHSETSGKHASALRGYLDELTPSTEHAHAAFSDLQGTLKEMWEHPKQGIADLVKAVSSDLGPALGTIGIGAGLAGGALVALGGIAFELAEHVAQVGASIERGSIISGIGAEQFSALKFAVEATGGSVDTLTNASFMLERRLADTGATGDKTRKALHELGISADEFAKLPVDQQILKISEGFRGLSEDTNKQSIVFDLLGRQGRELLPSLMKPLDDLTEKAHQLGLTWSEEDVKAAHDLEVQINILRLEFGKLTTDLGKDLIPALTEPLHFAEYSLGWLLTNPNSPVANTLQDLQFHAKLVKTAFAADQLGDTPTVKAPGFAGDTTIKDIVAGLSVEVWGYNDALIETAKQQELFKKAVEGQRDALEGDTKTIRAQVEALNELIAGGITDEEVKRRVIEAITKLEIKGVALTQRIYDWDAANRELLDSTNQSATALDKYRAIVDTVDRSGEAFSGVVQAMARDAYGFGLTLPTARFGELHEAITGVSDTVENDGIPALASFAIVTDVTTGKTESFDEMSQRLRDTLKSIRHESDAGIFDSLINDLDRELPNALQRAFEGGGGLQGAIRSISAKVGADIGKGISTSIHLGVNEDTGEQSKMGSLLSAGLSGGLAALTQFGIGKLVSFLSNIGGPSAQELQGRDAEKQFEQSMGGWQGIQKALLDTGMAADQVNARIQALWTAEKGGAEATKAAITQITDALTAHQKAAADTAAGIKSSFSGINQELTGIQENMTFNLKDIFRFVKGDELKALEEGFKHTKSGAKDLFDFFRQQVQYYRTEQEGSPLLETWISGHTLSAIQHWANEAQSYMDHLGLSIATTFAAEVKNTGNLGQALDELGPSLDKIVQLQDEFGLKSSDAVQSLVDMRKAGLANKDVIDVLGGITLQVGGLTQATRATQEEFNGFGDDASAMYTTLTERGTASNVALALMQPTLQKLWEAQQKFGFTADETTKKLIDQGVKQGLVGEDMKSVNDQLLDVLKQIRDALTGVAQKTTDWGTALRDLPTHIETTVATRYIGGEDSGNYAADGGFALQGRIAQYFGAGGFPGGPRGTDIIPAWLTDGESVLTRSATQFLGPDLIRSLNRNRPDFSRFTSGGGMGDVHIQIQGPMFLRDREAMADLATVIADAINDKVRGVRQLSLRTGS